MDKLEEFDFNSTFNFKEDSFYRQTCKHPARKQLSGNFYYILNVDYNGYATAYEIDEQDGSLIKPKVIIAKWEFERFEFITTIRFKGKMSIPNEILMKLKLISLSNC